MIILQVDVENGMCLFVSSFCGFNSSSLERIYDPWYNAKGTQRDPGGGDFYVSGQTLYFVYHAGAPGARLI